MKHNHQYACIMPHIDILNAHKQAHTHTHETTHLCEQTVHIEQLTNVLRAKRFSRAQAILMICKMCFISPKIA